MATTTLAPRLAAAAGLLYPILLVVGDDIIARGDEVASDAGTPEELLAALSEKDTASFFFGRSLGLIAWMCFFVFAAYVAVQLRRHRGRDDVLAAIALGGGAIAAALALGSSVFQVALVRRAGAGLEADTAVTMLDFGFGFVIAWLPLSLLMLAMAVEGVRGTFMARSVAWTGGALAVAFVVGFVLAMVETAEAVGFFAVMLSWPWFVAASISLIRRAGRPVEPSTPSTRLEVGSALADSSA